MANIYNFVNEFNFSFLMAFSTYIQIGDIIQRNWYLEYSLIYLIFSQELILRCAFYSWLHVVIR